MNKMKSTNHDKASNKQNHYYSWKKFAPKVDKDAAGLHTKVIVRKNGEKAVTSVLIGSKDNPFYNKKIGDCVSLKGEKYKIVAIRSVQRNNAIARKENR